MPTYMTQFSYTREAWTALAKDPEYRGPAFSALIAKLGGRMIGFYHQTGDYDGFVIYEAPDGETAATAIVAALSPGHLKTTKTSQLFTMEETIGILTRAGSLVDQAPK